MTRFIVPARYQDKSFTLRVDDALVFCPLMRNESRTR